MKSKCIALKKEEMYSILSRDQWGEGKESMLIHSYLSSNKGFTKDLQ